MNPRGVNQVGDSLVESIIFAEIFRQQQKKLPSNDFVAVHVRDVLEFRYKRNMTPRVLADLQNPQISILNAFAGRVELCELWVSFVKLSEQLFHLHEVVMLEVRLENETELVGADFNRSDFFVFACESSSCEALIESSSMSKPNTIQ